MSLVRSRSVEPEKFWIAGAGAKNFYIVEPEPEILVPDPQPWYIEDLQTLSLLCDVRYSTMEKFMRTCCSVWLSLKAFKALQMF